MPDPERVSLYCDEARNIVTHAEKNVQILRQSAACEGHKLIAAQYIVALKHLEHILEKHRSHVAFVAVPDIVVSPASLKRHWWSVLRRGPKNQGHAAEARI